jgi:ribonucleoside-diphosphate reductase alpha chain
MHGVTRDEVPMTNVFLDPQPGDTANAALRDVALPVRARLPETRKSITHKFSISGHEGYLTVGLFENGRPGELFIKMAKEGSTMSGLMDTIGILTSLALQYGVPVEALAGKFQNMRFEPSGWTRNPEIREATSVVDYVFRWLGIEFSSEFCNEQQLRGASAKNQGETAHPPSARPPR